MSPLTLWVLVDFTNQEQGLVWAHVPLASNLVVGTRVVAFDPDDDLCADAHVARIEGNYVYLEVNWDRQRSLAAEPVVGVASPLTGVWAGMVEMATAVRMEDASGEATPVVGQVEHVELVA